MILKRQNEGSCGLTPLRRALSRGRSGPMAASGARRLLHPAQVLSCRIASEAAIACRIEQDVTRRGVQTPLWAHRLDAVEIQQPPPSEAVPDTTLAGRLAPNQI